MELHDKLFKVFYSMISNSWLYILLQFLILESKTYQIPMSTKNTKQVTFDKLLFLSE